MINFWCVPCILFRQMKFFTTNSYSMFFIPTPLKKILFSISILLFISCTVAAQNTFTVGPEISIGGQQFEKGKKIGVGFSGEYMAKIFPKGDLRIYAGYSHFEAQNGRSKNNFIPVRAGYQHFLYSDNLFAYGEAGITHFNFSSGDKTGFSAAVGTGYKINMPNATLLQFSVIYQYNHFATEQNFNWLTLKAAYGFKFGKRKTFKRE